MLRPKRRSKSEMKPKTSEELKPKTSELHSKSWELNPKLQNRKAKISLLKPKTAELKKIQPETPGPKPRPQS